jgi:hypothetical protein
MTNLEHNLQSTKHKTIGRILKLKVVTEQQLLQVG